MVGLLLRISAESQAGDQIPWLIRSVAFHSWSARFLVISVGLGYWQVVAADTVLEKPTNPRIVEEERRILRGRILDRNGEVLAESERVGELAERHYSYPPLAHVTGYVSTQYGKSGVEEAYDSYLRGDQPRRRLTRFATSCCAATSMART